MLLQAWSACTSDCATGAFAFEVAAIFCIRSDIHAIVLCAAPSLSSSLVRANIVTFAVTYARSRAPATAASILSSVGTPLQSSCRDSLITLLFNEQNAHIPGRRRAADTREYISRRLSEWPRV